MNERQIVIVDGVPQFEDGRRAYPLACSECTHEFYIAKSLMMEGGINSGCLGCPECNVFLHVELTPDINGNAAKSEPHANYVARQRGTNFLPGEPPPAWQED